MKSRGLIVGVLLGVVLLLIWNLFIFAPKGRALNDAKKDTATAEQLQSTLRTQLANLQEIKNNGPAIAAELDKLNTAIPAEPDLDGFILSANEIAVKSGIDWLSVSPAVVQAGTEGPSEIPLSIQIKGGFFQVLDYLNRLEAMGRLVIVDGINLSAGAATTGGSSSSSTTAPSSDTSSSGSPTLSVTLTARMFTRAQPPAAPGSAPTPGPASSTSDSSPPASGSSSGETSTTAQVN